MSVITPACAGDASTSISAADATPRVSKPSTSCNTANTPVYVGHRGRTAPGCQTITTGCGHHHAVGRPRLGPRSSAITLMPRRPGRRGSPSSRRCRHAAADDEDSRPQPRLEVGGQPTDESGVVRPFGEVEGEDPEPLGIAARSRGGGQALQLFSSRTTARVSAVSTGGRAAGNSSKDQSPSWTTKSVRATTCWRRSSVCWAVSTLTLTMRALLDCRMSSIDRGYSGPGGPLRATCPGDVIAGAPPPADGSRGPAARRRARPWGRPARGQCGLRRGTRMRPTRSGTAWSPRVKRAHVFVYSGWRQDRGCTESRDGPPHTADRHKLRSQYQS